MSEEQNQNQPVNNELTERVNHASIANSYTLLNGGTDNIVMISGEKNGKTSDMLVTLEGISEVVNQLKKEANEL